MKNKINLYSLILLSLFVYSCKSGKEKLSESIAVNEKKLFADSTNVFNPAIADEILKSYKEYVEKYPDDTLAAMYLFKAADLSTGTGKFKEAIDLYAQFLKKYPDHRKAAASLFLQGFIYDTNLHDVENAKMFYSEFLQKYPNHQLAASAKASLEQLNMGLTDEQLIRMFEAKNDSLANAGDRGSN